MNLIEKKTSFCLVLVIVFLLTAFIIKYEVNSQLFKLLAIISRL
jgi:hypothetical protein